MKESQCMLYAERIERAIRHLENSVSSDQTASLTDLASVAGMSEFHFHRIFRLMTGETVGALVRRVRLSRSLPELANGSPVTQAAGSSGYATSQSFARALQAQAGTSATSVRADPSSLEALAARLLRPQAGENGKRFPLQIEIVEIDPIRVLAIRNVGTYAELNLAYSRLFELVLAQVRPEALMGIYGLPYDDPLSTESERLRSDVALAVGNSGQPQGELTELHLGGGTFARLSHHGDYDRIQATVDLAYAATLLSVDRNLADLPFFIHYLHDPEETPEKDLQADIYLPLS